MAQGQAVEHKQRIELKDMPADILAKLGEGDPRAMRVLADTMQQGPTIDPDSAFGDLGAAFMFDIYGIYGSRIWMLYSDLCGQDLVRVFGLLRAVQLGLLRLAVLEAAIREPYLLPLVQVDALVARVRERLPRFGVKAG